MVINKAEICELRFNDFCYRYNVRIWTSIDGKEFWCCDNGKNFKTLREAEEYAKSIK